MCKFDFFFFLFYRFFKLFNPFIFFSRYSVSRYVATLFSNTPCSAHFTISQTIQLGRILQESEIVVHGSE